mgnify:CR=1 FL=1
MTGFSASDAALAVLEQVLALARRMAVHLRARAAGVVPCVIPAVAAANFDTVRLLAHAQHDAYALGIHPLYTPQATEAHLAQLDAALHTHRHDTRLVAVGEIGLDGFVPELNTPEALKKQQQFYKAQLKLAQQHQLPVILHVRRSADLLLKGLRDTPVVGGIAHAFNGSLQQAQAFIALGFKLGFGGALTYDRALQLRRLATELPLSAIVLETDAPDIPPHWLYSTAEQRAAGQREQHCRYKERGSGCIEDHIGDGCPQTQAAEPGVQRAGIVDQRLVETPPHLRCGRGIVFQEFVVHRQVQALQHRQRRGLEQRGEPAVESPDLDQAAGRQDTAVQPGQVLSHHFQTGPVLGRPHAPHAQFGGQLFLALVGAVSAFVCAWLLQDSVLKRDEARRDHLARERAVRVHAAQHLVQLHDADGRERRARRRDERVAEEGEPTDGPGARHRHHRGGQRVGHLVLDDLRRLARVDLDAADTGLAVAGDVGRHRDLERLAGLARGSPLAENGKRGNKHPPGFPNRREKLLDAAMAFNPNEWREELISQGELYLNLYDNLPKELIFQRELLAGRL